MEHHCARGGVQSVSMGFSVDEALTIKKQLEDPNTYIQEMNIYFSDREIAEKAIEEFKDDLIKLYTWDFNF